MTLQEKLQNFVNKHSDYVEKDGSSEFSVCEHYNWDKDLWLHRQSIIDALRKRGYSVSVYVRWGVTDIEITKPIQLS